MPLAASHLPDGGVRATRRAAESKAAEAVDYRVMLERNRVSVGRRVAALRRYGPRDPMGQAAPRPGNTEDTEGTEGSPRHPPPSHAAWEELERLFFGG